MDITPLIGPGRQIVQSYGPGRFTINGVGFAHAIIVTPEAVMPWPFDGPIDALTGEDCAPLLALAGSVDVLLIGSGAKAARPSAAIRAVLKDAGLNVDAMDTGAACRTYNVLMAEGRRVAAALLPT